MILMRIQLLASFALAICAACGASAHAAVVNYDFTGNSSGLPSGNLGVSTATTTSGGLQLTIDGVDETGAAGILARSVNVGLGVVGLFFIF